MKKYLSKIISVAMLFAVALCVLVAPNSTAQADTGPKPSVRITFKNMGDELCYCTLLSERDSTGPFSVWNGDEDYMIARGIPREVFMAFVNYKDSNGFYFLQFTEQINESKSFVWGYHPPYTFKVLLYFPETNTFVSSDIYEQYAFDSYFAINMKGVDITVTSTEPQLTLTNNYNYFKEFITLICRIAITVAVELGIAWLFRFRGKKVWQCLIITNVVTQLLLNIILNIANYYDGMFMLILVYFLAEFIVFAVEAITYSIALHKLGDPKVPVWKSIVYAFTANLVSFVVGMVLALFLPVIF